jgi:hypothetical protein
MPLFSNQGVVMRIKLIIGFVLTFLAFLAAPSVAEEADQDFKLVNRTGYDLEKVFVSPSKLEDWGNDVMGRDVLGDGDSVNIKFHPKAKTCQWDLKVIYTVDGSSAIWHDIDLCSVEKITIRYNKNTDKTTATFD